MGSGRKAAGGGFLSPSAAEGGQDTVLSAVPFVMSTPARLTSSSSPATSLSPLAGLSLPPLQATGTAEVLPVTAPQSKSFMISNQMYYRGAGVFGGAPAAAFHGAAPKPLPISEEMQKNTLKQQQKRGHRSTSATKDTTATVTTAADAPGEADSSDVADASAAPARRRSSRLRK